MPAAKTKVVTPLLPDQDPFAGFIPVEAVSPPFLSTPAATGPEKVQFPPALAAALPSAPPAPAATPSTPAQDPFAGYTEVAPAQPGQDPFAGYAEVGGVVTPERVMTADLATLAQDKEFRPVEFFAANKQAILDDPALFSKVQEAYTAKVKGQKGAVRGFLSAVKDLAVHPVETAGKAAELGKTLGKAVVEPFAVAGRAAGRASAGDFSGAAGEVAALPQGLISAGTRDINIARKIGRGVKEALPFGIGAPETPEDFKSRLLADVEMHESEQRAREGNNAVAKALGVDSESLAQQGIEVNPESVEKLSVTLDPINFIPVGAAIGVVGKGGKYLLAKAANPAVAEAVAKTLNAAASTPGALVSAGLDKAGALTQKIGTAVASETGKQVANVVGAVAGAVKAGPVGAIAGAQAGRAAGAVGKAVEIVGRGARKAAPVVGNIVTEGVKGGLEAGAVTFPLTIGASDEERDALMANIPFAAGLRPVVAVGGQAARAGARATRDAVAARVYKTVERAETPQSPGYTTDLNLDAAHEENMAGLPQSTQNVVNFLREKFRPAGVEIYTLDTPEFVRNVDDVGGAEKAKGFYVKRGEKLGPDGNMQPVQQIFLNKGADGVGHELYHAFEALDKEGAKALKEDISKSWSDKEKAEWKDTYESALNGGRPREQWTRQLSDDNLLSEAAAEIFGRVVEATDLSGVKPSIQQRAATFLQGVLDKTDFPIAGKNLPQGPGVSEQGIRGSAAQFKIAQDFLRNISEKVKENGGVIGEPIQRPSSPKPDVSPVGEQAPLSEPVAPAPVPVLKVDVLTPEVKIPKVAPAPAPVAPAVEQVPAVRLPTELPPPVPVRAPEFTPEAPAARNIRTTRTKQNDFSAERAKVTNTEQAAQAALTPEAAKVVADVNEAVKAGQTAFEVEHSGVKTETGAGKPAKRAARRTEQEEAYVKESEGALPAEVRDPHQKVTSFVRWEFTKDGKPQMIGYSLDKAIANIEHLARWAKEKGVPSPYSNTPQSWKEAVQDLKDYYNNQANGYRGDGQKLVRPTEDIQVSLPPENPNYTPVQLSPEKTQFLNVAQGTQLAVPLTAREVKGKIPGNVKGQLLAELQGVTPAAPAGVAVGDIGKQSFKTPVKGRKFDIAEVNPYRNKLVKAGVPVRELIEVTERLNVDDVVSAKARPDLDIKPGVTDTVRSGFLPGREEAVRVEVDRRLAEKERSGIPPTAAERQKTQKEVEFDERAGKRFEVGEEAGFFLPAKREEVANLASELLDASPEEFDAKMKAAGGLTNNAFEVGMGLQEPEALPVLQAALTNAQSRRKLAMAAKNIDAAFSYSSRSQYFREAYEAATGTGGSAEFLKKELGDKYKPPFPIEEPATAFLPAREEIQTEVQRRLDEDAAFGMPVTDSERQQTTEQVEFEARTGEFLPAAGPTGAASAGKGAKALSPAMSGQKEPDYEKLADAIYRAEGGAKARSPYGILSVKVKDAAEARRVAINTARNNYKRWIDAGKKWDGKPSEGKVGESIPYYVYLARKYTPPSSDPKGHKNWLANVPAIYDESTAPREVTAAKPAGPKEVSVVIKADGSVIMTGPTGHKPSGALDTLKSKLETFLGSKKDAGPKWWIPEDKPAEKTSTSSSGAVAAVKPGAKRDAFAEVAEKTAHQEEVAKELGEFSRRVMASPELIEGKWFSKRK